MAKKTSSTAVADQGQTAVDAAIAAMSAAGGSLNIPIDRVIVEDQVRSECDTACESFQAFMHSIDKVGVIAPIGVTPKGDKYLLRVGGRRYRACQMLGWETIPARIMTDIRTREQILTVQLIENFQREDLDPIDKANGILAFFQARHDGIDLDQVCNVLILSKIDPGRVETEYGPTVDAIVEIAGSSIGTLNNLLSLLKLPAEIRNAVKTGAVSVSLGYIFAENLDNPGLMAVFEEVLRNPVTIETLKAKLKKAAEAGQGGEGEARPPFNYLDTSIQTTMDRLLSGKVRYNLIELENLHLRLMALDEVVLRAKAGGGTAAEPPEPETPGKKKKIIA